MSEAGAQAGSSREASIFSDRRIVVVTATLCCFLWGSAFPGVKSGYLLLGIAPADLASLLLFAGIRFVAAGLILLAWAGLSGKILALDRRGVGRVALLGLTQTSIQYVFYYVGLAHATGAKASIMNSTSTFFAVLLAHVLYVNDRLTLWKTLGCLVGFAGVITVNVSGLGFDFDMTLLGEGFIVISAFVLSLAMIYGKRVSQTMDASVMTGWQLAIGGAILCAAGLLGGGRFTGFGWEAGLLLAYLSVLSAVAFALWSVLMKHNPVSFVSTFNFLIPIFGVMLSGIFLGENILEWKNAVALVLVSAGIWLVTRDRPKVAAPVI